MKPIGPRSNYCIDEAYVERPDVPHFDDTRNQEEWQAGVYLNAQRIALHYDLHTVLDMGCGSGFKLRKYFAHMHRTGVEVDPTLTWLRQAYPREAWLSPEEEYGHHHLVICADVIEHVPDPDALISRILSAQPSWVVISTPDSYILGNETGPPRNAHHVREWNADQFRAYLEHWFHIDQHFVPDPFTQCVVARPR